MILAIVGPTGVGKTRLSIALAKLYNGEIINCDSTQIYKGLNVGTAKATKEERDHIPHHLIDMKDINEEYSVYDYQKDARNCIEEIKSRGKIPIFVGGTGLYLKAALYDYKFDRDPENNKNYENLEVEDLEQRINAFDLDISYDHKNKQRMIRILTKLENNKFIEENAKNLIYDDVIFIGLTTDREKLYQKINKRFDEMIIPLIDEIKPFILEKRIEGPLKTAIGYKELLSFFENKKTLQETVEEIKQNTRNYAKRQYTWFLNQMDVTWFQVEYENFNKTIDEIINFIERKNEP